MKKLDSCRIPEACSEKMEQLRASLADVALMEVMELANELCEQLKGDNSQC